MSGHPYSRQFSKEEILKIKEMSKAGLSPREIMSSLRQSTPNLQVIAKNIYNEKQVVRLFKPYWKNSVKLVSAITFVRLWQSYST